MTPHWSYFKTGTKHRIWRHWLRGNWKTCWDCVSPGRLVAIDTQQSRWFKDKTSVLLTDTGQETAYVTEAHRVLAVEYAERYGVTVEEILNNVKDAYRSDLP